ncbi:MAG TPA: S-layer homology domain-containing protein, partial [Thermoanaerobaculia bacterium]|nr:S-layer homology domain-containing protein [Thermoanaerobaculia bacterium]
MRPVRPGRRALGLSLIAATALFGGGVGAILGACGPFTDVAADAFCPFVLEIFYLGITTGTTATTYDPTSNVSRLQMAAFLSRTVDGVLKRGSRRAALDQFWSSQNATVLGLTTVGGGAANVRSDGADVWVVNSGVNGTVSRVRGSDGKLLETWTGAGNA